VFVNPRGIHSKESIKKNYLAWLEAYPERRPDPNAIRRTSRSYRWNSGIPSMAHRAEKLLWRYTRHLTRLIEHIRGCKHVAFALSPNAFRNDTSNNN
jgi:hypothetical protein